MDRFKMIFNTHINTNTLLQPFQPQLLKTAWLNAPMIGRIHNAKSGCSACGKKYF